MSSRDRRAMARRPAAVPAALAVLAVIALASPSALAADREEAHYNVVVTLHNAGKWEAAIEKIDQRLAQELSEEMRARYLYAKGLAYEQGQKADQAYQTYAALAKAHAKAPEAGRARVAMLYLDHAAGRPAAVVAAYAAIDAKTLDKTQQRDLALIYAEALYALDRAAEAAKAYDEAVKAGVDPQQVAARTLDLAVRLEQPDVVLARTAAPVPGVSADLLALLRAEAFLGKGNWAEAAKEAAKTPANSPHAARAAFAQARALLKLGQTEQAIDPLKRAVAGLKDPPISARVALADCLVRHKRTDEANDALAAASKAAEALGADRQKERDDWTARLALLTIQLASDRGEHARVAREIQQRRASLPKDLLPQATYMRVHALREANDAAAVLATMKEDLAALAGTEYDAPAVGIYADALRAQKRGDALRELVEAFVKRQPKSPQAAPYRLQLAQMAQDANDAKAAAAWLDQVLSDPEAAKQVERGTLQQARYNRALLARKQGQPDQAITMLQSLLSDKPDEPLRAAALVQLGDAHLDRGDHRKAAEALSQAIALAAAGDRDALRDRLARLWFAAGDHKAACEQFAELARTLGGVQKLSPASRHAYAQALAETGKGGEAAALLGALSEESGDPGRAFEAALLLERAGQPAQAEPWYARAAKKQSELSPAYAKSVDASLARVRLAAAIGDRGAAYWLSQLAPESQDAAFDPAAAALRRIADANALSAADLKAAAEAAAKYAAEAPRRYALGAVEALALWRLAEGGKAEAAAELRKRADALLADYEKNESRLKGETAGTTIAPAILYFTRGEALRRMGKHAEAMADYETVLAAYPYNEWPEAAACGAAECFLQAGDKNMAKAKFQEAAKSTAAGATTWIEYAKKRLAQLGE